MSARVDQSIYGLYDDGKAGQECELVDCGVKCSRISTSTSVGN